MLHSDHYKTAPLTQFCFKKDSKINYISALRYGVSVRSKCIFLVRLRRIHEVNLSFFKNCIFALWREVSVRCAPLAAGLGFEPR